MLPAMRTVTVSAKVDRRVKLRVVLWSRAWKIRASDTFHDIQLHSLPSDENTLATMLLIVKLNSVSSICLLHAMPYQVVVTTPCSA